MSRIPKPIAGCNLKSLPIGPKEAFIFSRIDGMLDEDELASMTGLPASEVAAVLEQLASLGAIEFPGASSGPGPNSSVRPSTRPAPSYDPKELEEDVEIDLDRKHRILELYAKLDKQSYYELLGVPRDADKKQIKNAYYDLAPEVHPDKFFRKQLGSYKAKIEAIFARITLAHDVLSSKQRRAEYDRELAETTPSSSARSPAPSSAVPTSKPKKPLTSTAASGVMPVVREPLPVAEPASPEVRRETLARKLSGGAIQKPVVSDAPPEPPPQRLSPNEAAVALRSRYENARDHALRVQIDRELETGRQAIEREDYDAASQAYRKAAALAPEDLALQASTQKTLHRIAAAQAEDFLKRAEQLETLGRFSDAALAYAKACAGRSDDAVLHDRAANAALKAGINPRRIVEYARRAVELAPGSADHRFTLARAYAAAGLEESARGECARALELAPADARIRALALELKELNERREARGKVS